MYSTNFTQENRSFTNSRGMCRSGVGTAMPAGEVIVVQHATKEKDMRLGTIGAGTIGTALARHAINAGYPVTLSNSRGPETLAELVAELGPLATAGTVVQAAQADIVFLAVGYLDVTAALAGLPDF